MSADFWSRDSGARRPRPDIRRVVGVALCVLLLAGCRLDLAIETTVGADGSGTVVLAAGFDAAMLEELDALGVDPSAELEATMLAIPAWEVERRSRADGGLEVRASHTVDDASELGDVLRELSDGLRETDPAMLVDLDVAVGDDGGTEVTGTARFRPPGTAGVTIDGGPLGPEADELAAIVGESVDARFRMEFPGVVAEHDGSVREGRSVVWDLPVGETVSVRASADPPAWWSPVVDWWEGSPLALRIGLGAVVLALAGAGVLWGRSVRRAA